MARKRAATNDYQSLFGYVLLSNFEYESHDELGSLRNINEMLCKLRRRRCGCENHVAKHFRGLSATTFFFRPRVFLNGTTAFTKPFKMIGSTAISWSRQGQSCPQVSIGLHGMVHLIRLLVHRHARVHRHANAQSRSHDNREGEYSQAGVPTKRCRQQCLLRESRRALQERAAEKTE